MGCNSSKREDVDRERRALSAAASPAQRPATQPANITNNNNNEIPRSVNRAIHSVGSPALSGSVDGVYGTSYTNRKTQEYELLHQIVQDTRSNFIDVASKAEQLDDEDINERAQNYQKQLFAAQPVSAPAAASALSGSLATHANTLHNIFAQPTPASDSNGGVRVTVVASADLEFIQSAAQSISEAVARAQLAERGKLVKTFEEL